jgi:hypothetical protein
LYGCRGAENIRATATAVERLPPADIEKFADIPAVLIHGRLDLSSPLDVPWTLAEFTDAASS